MKGILSRIISFIICSFFALVSVAQPPDSLSQTINIASAYKPVVQSAAKINLSASNFKAETDRTTRPYDIPAQNLFYAYRPITLKPLALDQETGPILGMRNFIKAGFGSYKTPYLSAALGLGDGEKYLLDVKGEYISSSSDFKYQQFSRLGVIASGSYFTPKNELYGAVGIRRDNYFLYGYDHTAHDYSRQDVLQQFQDFSITAGMRNREVNELGVNYNPTVKLNILSVKDKASETTLLLDVPFNKNINEKVNVNVAFRGDFTSFSTHDYLAVNYKLSNNLVFVAPSFSYVEKPIDFHVGLTPAWDNGKFTVLPDVKANAKIFKNFSLQAGWVGRIIKNSYRNLTLINPYLESDSFQLNTNETEFYGGIRGGLGGHFSFDAKVGWVTYKNLALFINDTAALGKGFRILNEELANNFRIHGSLNYIKQDKFSATGAVTLNGYTGFKEKAWHMPTLEMNADLKWQLMKKWVLKSDFYLFAGGNYRTSDGEARDLTGGVDLSMGVEYKVKKNFSAWLDVNNLLNDKYERWHAYPVYGINLLAGMIIRF